MSSGVFSAHNDGACGLSGQSGCAGLQAGEQAFYLTCRGNVPGTVAQLTHSRAEDGYATGFRIRKTGERTVERGRGAYRRTYTENVYGWQERDGSACAVCRAAQNGQAPQATGAPRRGYRGRTYTPRERCSCTWRDIAVWSHIVHADCAQRLGFNVPGRTTVARPGRRELGHEHRADETPSVPESTREIEEYARSVLSQPPAYVTRDAQRDSVSALANVAAEAAANAQAAETSRASQNDGQGRYVGTWLDNDAARAERARAIAERNRLAAERAAPKPVNAESRPQDVPADVEDVAAFQRFARLELD